jgi:putative ABC transport system permease protein
MLTHYLKLAVKILRRRKVFTFISLFGVSFSLLVLMVVSAFFDHAFAAHYPETRSDRTLGVYALSMRGPQVSSSAQAGYRFLDRYVRPMEDLPQVQAVAIYGRRESVVSYPEGRRIQSALKRTDGAFWQVFDFDFLEGRPFTPDDDKNARPVAVINETTRRRFFGGAPAVGRYLHLGGERFRVVGVVRDVSTFRRSFADVWVPLSTIRGQGYRREWLGNFTGILLVRDRSDFQAVREEFQSRLEQAKGEVLDRKFYDELTSGADTLFEGTAQELLRGVTDTGHGAKLVVVLWILLTLFLFLPSLNLININLSRILERGPEIGVRKAFGATSGSLLGQFLVENIVLTLIGGLIAFVLSAAVLAAFNASELIPYARFSLNGRVFLQGLGIAFFLGLLSGVYPAWRISRLHPIQALKGGAL